MNKKKLIFVFLLGLFVCLSFADDKLIVNLDENEAVPTDVAGPASVDTRIRRLLIIREQDGEEAALAYAKRFEIPYSREKGVRVVAIASSPLGQGTRQGLSARAVELSTNRLANQVQSLGGLVLHRNGLNVSCRMPLESVNALVGYAKTIHLPFRLRSHVTSEGVGKIGATALQNQTPFRGEDVNVCIMDIGFQYYDNLLGTELPADFVVDTVREDGKTTDIVHGTACAEIVHDVAPDAKLFGLATYYVDDVVPATQWILSQDPKIDIVSASIGHYYAPGDGTGVEDEMAKLMKANETLYVTSAGNEGNDHWSGTFSDPDGDGWHNFSGQDEILSFYVPAYNAVSNYLRWNDWGAWNANTMNWAGATQDYDLYLYIKNSSTGEWQQIPDASSLYRQPGFSMPIETASGYYASVGATWGVAIRKHKATRNVRFDLFCNVHSGNLEYSIPAGSLGIPGDSPNIIAVGASDAVTDVFHSYSSQGPTLDGRIKPDLSAPSGVSVSDLTYGSRSDPGFGFYGTSASCPHMAGLLALFKSRTPFSVEQLLNSIYARVLDLGTPGHDNKFGRGRISVSGN